MFFSAPSQPVSFVKGQTYFILDNYTSSFESRSKWVNREKVNDNIGRIIKWHRRRTAATKFNSNTYSVMREKLPQTVAEIAIPNPCVCAYLNATSGWPIMDFALYCQAYMPRKSKETRIWMESVPLMVRLLWLQFWT